MPEPMIEEELARIESEVQSGVGQALVAEVRRLQAEVAARAAMIEGARGMLGLFIPWNVSPEQIDNLGRILSANPSTVLAARDAEKWWHGVNDQWKHRPIGNRMLEQENPYRKEPTQ